MFGVDADLRFMAYT